MATTWTISRRQGTCSRTGAAFGDGERHISMLVVQDGALQRYDLSLAAWRELRSHDEDSPPLVGQAEDAAGDAAGAPAEAKPEAKPEAESSTEDGASLDLAGVPAGVEPLFWWMTRHEVTKKKTVQLDMDSLAELFIQLEGRDEIQVRELRYVLCLLLMRKRRVKVEKVLREGDEESFVVKRPRSDQRYKVYVYDFEPERLDEVRAQLQAVFDGAEGPCGVRLTDGEGDSQEETSSVEVGR